MGIALRLPETQRIEIAERLFKVTSRQPEKGELSGLCPIHDESNPSFGYNYLKDTYSCFSCGANGDLAKLWYRSKGIRDNKEGFKAFCREFAIESGQGGAAPQKAQTFAPRKEPPPLNDAYGLLGPLPEDWIARLVKTRGWSRQATERLGIRQQTHYQAKNSTEVKKLHAPERIAIPVRDAAGNVRNIRLYKPGAKEMKIISWGTAYGSARLFPCSPVEEGPVLLCEGEPDTICAISHGFNAITQTTKPKKWPREQLKEFEGRDVVIAYDADQVGQKYAVVFAGPELLKVAKSVKLLEWPDYMGRRDDGQWPEDHGEDLTDFFVKHGKSAEDLQALMDAAMPMVKTVAEYAAMPRAFYARGVNDRLSFKPVLLARKLVEEVQILHDPTTGLLYQWNGKYWQRYHEDYLKYIATTLLGDEADSGKITNAVSLARGLAVIPGGRAVNDWEAWCCIQNGMLNLRTLELKPHSPDFYATYMLNVVFNPDSKKRCDKLEKYLRETIQTPEVIAQMQEFAGYCMTRETRFQKCLLLYGPGSDGKGVFLRVLRELVGAENCSAVSFEDLENEFARASLYMKSLNIATEMASSKAFESQYFKTITGYDAPIRASFKHKDGFEFIPYTRFAFATNKLPKVLDNTDGYFRRLLPVQFKRQFKEDDPATDLYLFDKLKEELSEIFLWALAGLHRLWQQGRFTESEETKALIRKYQRLNNPVVCFIEDVCILGDGLRETKRELYKKYKEYSQENGYSPLSRENFFRELYSAKESLRACRPRIDGKPEHMIEGVAINSLADA